MLNPIRNMALLAAIAAAIAIPAKDANAQNAYSQHRQFDGAVFAMTNATAGNQIVIYGRHRDGTLTRLRNVPTHGLGIGVDTDTQGPLQLSEDHRFLYAVNPGSDNISVFAVKGTDLELRQIIYAGDQPLSLTISGDHLYALDGSVAGNGIRGFTITQYGLLRAMPNSFRALSSPVAVPGNIQFSPDGQTILVTQKTTNELLTPENAIDAFKIGTGGFASAKPIRDKSFGVRPFSLAFRDDGKFAVAESHNANPTRAAMSSYRLNASGTFTLISGSVPNGQTDTCWVVLSKDQRYAYTSNFGTGTISSYRFEPSGALKLIKGRAAFFGITSEPVDSSLSEDGHYLYQLLRGPGAVAALRIESDASLTPLGVTTGGLPVNNGISGLAAY